MNSRNSTTQFLQTAAGRSAYIEALNLLGCAFPHPSGKHFMGAAGEHVISCAVRFAVNCRRWLELTGSNDPDLYVALHIEGMVKRAEIPTKLNHALNQIVHCKTFTVATPLAIFDEREPVDQAPMQKRFYSLKYPVVALKLETDKRKLQTVPLIILLDAFFLAFPSSSRALA